MEVVDFQRLIEVCRAHGTRKITLFGSFVRNEAGPESDIDLIVAFSEPTGLLSLVRLERELSELLGRPVDLVTEEAISPHLRERIHREERVIYEAAG
jgi:predicted nucleotidyltransferase